MSQNITTSDESEGNTQEASQIGDEEPTVVTEEVVETSQEDNGQGQEKIKTNIEPVTKKRKSDGLIEEMRKSRHQREKIMENIIQKQESTNNPVDIFFQGIAATVKTFPAQLIVEAKLAVSKAIADFELRAINQQNVRQDFYMSGYSASPSTSSGMYSPHDVEETEYTQL